MIKFEFILMQKTFLYLCSLNSSAGCFSPWAMNNGGGGALSYPPLLPENLMITKNETQLILNWDEVTLDTGGYSISGVTYDIYATEDPYAGWIPDESGVTETTWTKLISETKEFYRIVAVYIPQVE